MVLLQCLKGKGFWRTLFAYSGPGALVAVGYMDPGNWSTSITGGQNFQYLLMSVILMSSLIAMLLQYMVRQTWYREPDGLSPSNPCQNR